MTPERAAQIREAFGPCTSLYECWTVEEMINRAKEDDMTDQYFCHVQLRCESIVAEQMGCYSEWKEAKPAVLERLKAIGIEEQS